MAIYQFEDLVPVIADDCYVFPGADLIGDVRLEAGASVWPHVSIRADNAPIRIGRYSNIQENSVLHVDPGCPLTIADNVTVGHQAMLHGCNVGEGSLIGIQAIVLNHAHIGRNCLIGAGAIIPEGKEIPDNSLVIGIAKVVRQLSPEEIAGLRESALHYYERAKRFRAGLKRLDSA